ncbi:MAG TPA: ABC transporter substrate-binding protein [Gammaproteobacteria bacterium]|nr:ABC transporter substrate-binding protein [Gammaproteobacteria bacterium]
MKRLLMALLTALVVSTSAHAQKDHKYNIVLVPGLVSDDFYITMNRGAQAAAEAFGVNVRFQGPEEFDPVRQTPVLDAVIAQHPDAILIAPTDSTQMIEPLRRAHEQGIPVITVDTYIGDGKYQDGKGNADFPISYIASDNIEGGRIAARRMAKAIGDKGSVYVSNVRPGISTTDQRQQGFTQEMKENHPDITVLDPQYNDDDASKAASQFGAVLARHPDLKGVFGANLFSAIGAANGVQQAGAENKVQVIAFDAPQSIINNLKSGLVNAAIAQHPAEIGWYGVATAYAYLSGHSVPRKIGTGFTVIDKSNYDDKDIAKFIYSGNN